MHPPQARMKNIKRIERIKVINMTDKDICQVFYKSAMDSVMKSMPISTPSEIIESVG